MTSHYEVYKINEQGHITKGDSPWSGQWLFAGIRHSHSTNTFISFTELVRLLEQKKLPQLVYANGKGQWLIEDVDHGTRRQWGGDGKRLGSFTKTEES